MKPLSEIVSHAQSALHALALILESEKTLQSDEYKLLCMVHQALVHAIMNELQPPGEFEIPTAQDPLTALREAHAELHASTKPDISQTESELHLHRTVWLITHAVEQLNPHRMN